MFKVTRTIKLKFVNLNRCKAQLFEDMTVENTRIANELLSLPFNERRKMTTAKIVSELKSALVNQTIRHTNSPTGRKTKQYKVLPVEVNNQNWKLIKKGDTYSINFPTTKGEKRVPINADVVIEDLEGCRKSMRQTKKSRSDSGQSRHSWSYYSSDFDDVFVILWSLILILFLNDLANQDNIEKDIPPIDL